MYGPILDSGSFEVRLKSGLDAYKKAKKPVSFATLSLPWNSPLNLRQCFRELNRRVSRIAPMVKIEYLGVMVKQIGVEESKERYHAHIFWRKPFVKFDKLKLMWESIINGSNENFSVSTVTITPKSVDRVCFYCQCQQADHFPCEVAYFVSDHWGEIPKPKKREKKPYDPHKTLKDRLRRARAATLRDDE